MAGKKISCPKCRRSYDYKIEYCPFCGSQNPLLDTTNNGAATTSLKGSHSEDTSSTYEMYDNQGYYDESAVNVDNYQEEIYDDNTEPDENTSELSISAKRDKIQWTDEEHKDTSNHAPMYNPDGEFNPNFDHYYDDNEAKIESALDSLSNGKEKAILKILFGIAAIIGIIVYLILTLY